jgi:hypothetical protein
MGKEWMRRAERIVGRENMDCNTRKKVKGRG